MKCLVQSLSKNFSMSVPCDPCPDQGHSWDELSTRSSAGLSQDWWGGESPTHWSLLPQPLFVKKLAADLLSWKVKYGKQEIVFIHSKGSLTNLEQLLQQRSGIILGCNSWITKECVKTSVGLRLLLKHLGGSVILLAVHTQPPFGQVYTHKQKARVNHLESNLL